LFNQYKKVGLLLVDHFVGSETIQLLQGFNHFDPVTNGYLGIFPPGNGFDG
jgi:hypothetical protein